MLKKIHQLRNNLDVWTYTLDKRWRRLPLKKQRTYTIYMFLGYLIITVLIVLQICLGYPLPKHDFRIDHIDNSDIQTQEAKTIHIQQNKQQD